MYIKITILLNKRFVKYGKCTSTIHSVYLSRVINLRNGTETILIVLKPPSSKFLFTP